MKKLFLSLLSLVAVVFAMSAAHADPLGFNGAYDYATWTKVGTHLADTTSYIDGTQQKLTLMEPDNSDIVGWECYYANEGCAFNFSHTVAASGTVSFDWAFDWGIDPCCSGFNFYINSTLYALADGNPDNKYAVNGLTSGMFSASVNAGDVITFSAFSADACCGAASTTVTNFNAPANNVPEPSTVLLMGGAVAGLRLATRKKAKSK